MSCHKRSSSMHFAPRGASGRNAGAAHSQANRPVRWADPGDARAKPGPRRAPNRRPDSRLCDADRRSGRHHRPRGRAQSGPALHGAGRPDQPPAHPRSTRSTPPRCRLHPGGRAWPWPAASSRSRASRSAPTAGRGRWTPRQPGRFSFTPQRVSAHVLATREGFRRERCDAYAAQSHKRARAAAAAEHLDGLLVAVKDRNGLVVLDHDERTPAPVPAACAPAFSTLGQAGGFDGVALQ